ncbi:methionine--tRNA ligase [Patescibacteria group bacterium]|nr:methionine--tRNA ligase [Patescibacteria group bacterium]
MGKPFYLTTTLPYVNSDPHIGHALELVQADALVRFRKSQGDDVFFNTGTDEHGQKIFEAAEKAGKPIQEYVDHYANEFKKLNGALGLSEDLVFIRTTDEHHVQAAQEMWRRCSAKGDIYKKEFEGLYCVGCEKYLTQKEIVDGKCAIHGTEPKLLKEENYFFKLSNYQKPLEEYLSKEGVVIPEWRRQEALNFVREGLEDFSISRDKSRLSWGVPVPGDENQVMYVWFDALTNYISTLGWPNEGGDFKKFWTDGEVLQVAGKDQVRFQSIMWQAMLMSAEIKNTDQVFYHGFINSDGQKMSKSLGNVISPYDLVKKYGTDATRYLLLRHVHPTEDSDVTWARLDEWYTANLVNGLGNLVARVMKLAEDNIDEPVVFKTFSYSQEYENVLKGFQFNYAIDAVWQKIQETDERITRDEPFKVVKSDPVRGKAMLAALAVEIWNIGYLLGPFMPETSKIILNAVKQNKKPENLFPRLAEAPREGSPRLPV